MQIPVVIESIGEGQYRAQGLPPFNAIAEGATSEEALAKLRVEIDREVQSGKRVVLLDVPAKDDNPWLAMAGWLKDDPLYDEWQAAIREYRHERDVEDGIQANEQ